MTISSLRAAGAVALVCLVLSLTGGAQTPPLGYVLVTAAHASDATGTVIANATASFAPVSNTGTAISFKIGSPSGGQAMSAPVSTTVTNGVFSIQLADTVLSSPTNVCYSVTIVDNVSGNSLLGQGYTCVQPAGSGVMVTGAQAWCTAATGTSGGVCNWDNYTPNLAPLALTQAGATGSTGATGATGSTGATGATGPAPNLAIGTVTTGTAAATIGGVSPNFTLNLVLPSFNSTSAYTWTAIQTFSAGITSTKVVGSQASPASAAAFSNFGGTQISGSNLDGGVTTYDNGSSSSFGMATMIGGSPSHFGVGLYAVLTGGQANVFLCPTNSGTYPVAQASFSCPYNFTYNGFTSSQPFIHKMTSPASSAGFSTFGASLLGGAGLYGGATVYDDGSTSSFGMASVLNPAANKFGVALYAILGSGQANVYVCPTNTGTYPVAQASFSCPFVFTYTGLLTNLPISANRTAPSSSAGFSNFGAGLNSGTTLNGGITTYDVASAGSLGMTTIQYTNPAILGSTSRFAEAIYAYIAAQNADVLLCPTSVANGVYPVAQSSFTCNKYIFTATGAYINNPVTIASPAAVIPGALNVSDPQGAVMAATKVFATLQAKVHKGLPNKAPVIYSTNLTAFGDSITAGVGATSCASGGTCYIRVLAASLGATLTNNGFSSDQACDTAIKVFNDVNPTSTPVIYTDMIGMNDSVWSFAGYEPIYQSCHLAQLAFLAIPAANKVAGNTCTATSGTWAVDSTYSKISGEQSSTNGSVLTCSIATTGGPVYVWYKDSDTYAGSFTYSLNGGAAVTVSTTTTPHVATGNGATGAPMFIRIAPPAPGTQSVVFTVTSATGAANVVSILGLATPAQNAYYTGPQVTVGAVTYQKYDGNNGTTGTMASATAQYTLDALADQQELAGDGLDVRFTDGRSCMQGGVASEMDIPTTAHPNDFGHGEVAGCFLATVTAPPEKSVNRWTPASSAAACTPADVWADAAYMYSCVKSGQIVRAALAAF